MTASVDVVNRALQAIGTRTTVTSTELANNSTNEAIQANLILNQLRQDLLRMAPWNCSTNTISMTLITATPGTPENTSPGTTQWAKGQPTPPWAYEYQYPVDCLRPLWLIPQYMTGFAGGVPITTAVTGGAASFWQGPPVKYKVGIDQFYTVASAAVASGGTGYAIGDYITLASAAQGVPPFGAPVVLRVTAIGGGGSVTTVSVNNQLPGTEITSGGSYFVVVPNPQGQGSTTGAGVGATFNLTWNLDPLGVPTVNDQRVILTNQEFAVLCYVRDITNPNVMDAHFIDAWINILAARLANVLTGDKGLANMLIGQSNNYIIEARKTDGNEGLTINDITPDWIRVRGVNFVDWAWSPNQTYDWGALWTPY